MRARNLDVEREITRQACRGFLDPEPVIVHAETRALRLHHEYVPDAMLVRVDRDRPKDVREELADARNHLCWDIEDHPDVNPHGHPLEQRLDALRHICIAYHNLRAHQ